MHDRWLDVGIYNCADVFAWDVTIGARAVARTERGVVPTAGIGLLRNADQPMAGKTAQR